MVPGSMILKDDEGNDIKITVLRNPIPFKSLVCKEEDKTEKTNVAKTKLLHSSLEKHEYEETEMNTMTFLREPISLDTLDFEKTCDVKIDEKSVAKRPRKYKKDNKQQPWIENAVTLFELSYVYPFTYINNKYKCFVCSETFVDAGGLKQHSIDHNIQEIAQKLYSIANDTIVKVDVTHLQCRICANTFKNLQDLKGHLINHGKNIDCDAQDNLIPFRLGSEPFLCQICGEEYHKLRPLIIHMNKHFNNCSCEVCGSVFVSKKLLNRHLQTHETGIFPCGKCDKVFSNSAKKTLHIRGVHLKVFPRRCPICPERFKSDYMRTRHLRVIHNRIAGLNRCVTCGKEYDLKYQLQMHMRSVHYQEKNEECPVCHSRFFSKYLLSRHMIIHTGIRNFKCEVCGKTYVRKAHLKQHSKSHFVK